jgi:breast cancer metastasis-suppressor 1-like protein
MGVSLPIGGSLWSRSIGNVPVKQAASDWHIIPLITCHMNSNHNNTDPDGMDMDGRGDTDREVRSSDETDSESGSDSDGERDKGMWSDPSRSQRFFRHDLDEEECDKLKSEMTTEMTDLEKQFMALREQLYYERLNRVEEQLNGVRSGKSPDYLQPLEELQENLRIRTEVAGILKDLKLANVNCIHTAEQQAAQQHLDSECRAICDLLRQDLEEKLKRLEEDRNSIDSELWIEAAASSQLMGKKKKRHGHSSHTESSHVRDQFAFLDRRKKPVPVAGPYIVYMLRESEITEDYNLIRRASRSSNSYYYF